MFAEEYKSESSLCIFHQSFVTFSHIDLIIFIIWNPHLFPLQCDRQSFMFICNSGSLLAHEKTKRFCVK